MPARRRAPAMLAPAILLGLVACAEPPRLSVPEAERWCSQNLSDPGTGMTAQPRLSIGIGTGGYSGAGLGVDFTPDRVSAPRDPEMIFHRCVRERSGFPPSKSLYQQPGWARK
ncbi:MAG: hypothetical protein U1E41_04040 [Paracoccus sp. (in: a-proteobacteria)]